MCVCVCVCVCVCESACGCVNARVCVCVCGCGCVRAPLCMKVRMLYARMSMHPCMRPSHADDTLMIGSDHACDISDCFHSRLAITCCTKHEVSAENCKYKGTTTAQILTSYTPDNYDSADTQLGIAYT